MWPFPRNPPQKKHINKKGQNSSTSVSLSLDWLEDLSSGQKKREVAQKAEAGWNPT